MALLIKLKSFVPPITSKNTGILYNVVRTKVLTHHDWKPGPYPKTEAERRAAAEKYGMPYEEYEPYPDDGWGHGDYPKLPKIGVALKDPWYPYDWPEEKRNFGEVLHVERNILGEERCDFGEKPLVGYREAPTIFTLVMVFFFGLHYLLEPYQCFRPVLEKQIPQPGVVHYTFEPAR
ncbi:NADH dehydrogenase [ubiquinone] 1 beta subcomplex subunit 8, mitochondrial [Diachasma alloeum]|uniref:ASHI subunit, NADH-dehydrogenase n=1 Tax=Diachasma alloeum TaxID=454923 RepID=A0A4E0RJH6_9HYME|nr:NADH dehydrogenase [ubiquinone] 1 beta subcomplex subunit 8, mitochondrial [Diachasma alloeum]THK32902.1 ASHI subunit, NADH-dehydrogenase [Diachasma alloeum]